MQIIKHQNERIVNDIIQNAPIIDSADMIEEFSNVKFKRITDDKGGINMCKGMELCLLDTEIKGSIKTFRSMNVSEDEIVERVAELFNVKKDYVKELMTPKAV